MPEPKNELRNVQSDTIVIAIESIVDDTENKDINLEKIGEAVLSLLPEAFNVTNISMYKGKTFKLNEKSESITVVL
jgi:transcriptional regulator NrdR family protein